MRRLAAIATLALLELVPVAGGVARADARLPGIINGVDVSQWQATIDWPTVAGTSTRFVIMRATKAHDYEDPMYTTNLSGATNAGLVVGSYHRATPSGQDGDARREADHFLDVARNGAGDLLPVLDIEETGGLTPGRLTTWVRRWVERVRAEIGVRPMLYASPYFWRANMGDTTWFADHGYPLWIAHWGVSDPDVPAGNWAGGGYLVHQWTSTGHVDGIPTNVDRDRFPGTSLRTGRIASVTLAPMAGGRVTGARLSCGAGDATCARLINPGDPLTLTADPSPGAVLLRWTGACAGAGTSPLCTITAFGDETASAVFGYPLDASVSGTGGGSVTSTPPGLGCAASCSYVLPAGASVLLTAAPDSASAFVSWAEDCAGTTPTCTVTMNAARTVSARFDATTQLDQDDPGTSYRWGIVREPRAAGGRYLSERTPGASATFAFTGDAITLDTVRSPSMGRARVLVDGLPLGTINGCGSRFSIERRRFGGFGAGGHVLTIATGNTAPTTCASARVGVDALRWAGATHANPVPSVATWGPISDGAASGGALVRSETGGAEARLTFTGTGVTLLTVRGPTMGVAELRVDGVLASTWDLSGPTRTFVKRTVTGLDDESHVVRLIVTGRRGVRGHGRSVAVDGWIVR